MSMTPREYLSQVFRLEKKIKAKEIKSAEFESLAEGIAAPGNDGVNVSHSKNTEAPFTYWIAKKTEADEQIRDLREKQNVLKSEIMNAIEKIDDEVLQSLLVMRYLDFMTWEDVAAELSVSIATVYRWHRAALSLIKAPEKK